MRYGIKRLPTGNWTVFNDVYERVVFSHGFADSQTASDVAQGFTRETDRLESELGRLPDMNPILGLRPYQREAVEALLDTDSRVKRWKRRAAKANERADMAEARLRALRDPMKVEISEKKLMEVFAEGSRSPAKSALEMQTESLAEKNARGIRAVAKYVKFCCAIGREPADGGFASVKDVKLSFPSLSGTGHMSKDEAGRCFGKFGATLYFTNPPEEASFLDRYNTEATDRPRSEKVSPWRVPEDQKEWPTPPEQQPSRIHRAGDQPRIVTVHCDASGLKEAAEQIDRIRIVYGGEEFEIAPERVHAMRGRWFLRATVFLPNGETGVQDFNLVNITRATDFNRLKEMEAAALAVVEGAEPISAFKKVLDRD